MIVAATRARWMRVTVHSQPQMDPDIMSGSIVSLVQSTFRGRGLQGVRFVDLQSSPLTSAWGAKQTYRSYGHKWPFGDGQVFAT